MSKVIADITMSLDGSVTGPSGDVDELHAWVTEQDPVDTEILERATAATGAVVRVGGCSISSTGPMAGPGTWGTALNRRRRLRSSSPPTRRPSTSGWNGSWGCDSPSWTSCACTSHRRCSVAEHRCFGRARARGIANVTSALRATPSTSPTGAHGRLWADPGGRPQSNGDPVAPTSCPDRPVAVSWS
jgi:hypothetical protein